MSDSTVEPGGALLHQVKSRVHRLLWVIATGIVLLVAGHFAQLYVTTRYQLMEQFHRRAIILSGSLYGAYAGSREAPRLPAVGVNALAQGALVARLDLASGRALVLGDALLALYKAHPGPPFDAGRLRLERALAELRSERDEFDGDESAFVRAFATRDHYLGIVALQLQRMHDAAARELATRIAERTRAAQLGFYGLALALVAAVVVLSRRNLRAIDGSLVREAEATDALRASEEQLRLVVGGTNDGIWDWDIRARTYYTSARWKEILGYREGELPESDANFFELLHPDDRPRVEEAVRLHLEQLEPYSQEIRLRHRDADYRWLLARGEAVRDDAGRAIRMVGALTDITDRKRAEIALRIKDQAIATSITAIAITDADGQLVYVNPAFLKLWEVEREDEVLGTPLVRLAEGDMILQAEAATRTQGAWVGELVGKRASGTPFTVLLSASVITGPEGEVVNTMWSMLDLSERKQLEAQLLQVQKLESIGRLAGGVAHDFNNLLTAIIGQARLTTADLPPESPLHEGLLEVIRAADSAANLTRQLLAFSRKQMIDPRVLNLNEVIGRVRLMLQRLLGEHIEVLVELTEDLGQVRMDPGQAEQILVNLALNAKDAMPGGGKLTLETANLRLDASCAQRHPGVEPGDYVMVAVSDTGLGMSTDVKARIFEPFYTTKPVGKGTGLGLAMVYGAIKQHGGHVEVYSEPGCGTTFKIYLPLVDGRPESLSVPSKGGMPRGTETVILVEDDIAVQAVATRLLRRQGYTVHPFSGGEDALDEVRQMTGPLHLLMTDVVMPGMNGSVLAQRMQVLRPGIKVLYTSGYTENVVVRHGVVDPGVEFIPKPYSIDLLARRIRELLDTPG